jgi:hypothetical protein
MEFFVGELNTSHINMAAPVGAGIYRHPRKTECGLLYIMD